MRSGARARRPETAGSAASAAGDGVSRPPRPAQRRWQTPRTTSQGTPQAEPRSRPDLATQARRGRVPNRVRGPLRGSQEIDERKLIYREAEKMGQPILKPALSSAPAHERAARRCNRGRCGSLMLCQPPPVVAWARVPLSMRDAHRHCESMRDFHVLLHARKPRLRGAFQIVSRQCIIYLAVGTRQRLA